jgi:hypothetical protein
MALTELQIGDQLIRYDQEATAAIYDTLTTGGAEECGCIGCRNFAAQRDDIYPASFSDLLQQLGIDPAKDGWVYDYGPLPNGRYLYGGWFYLIGELIDSGEKFTWGWQGPPPETFGFFFTLSCPPHRAFRREPLLAIDFTAQVKWILPETPEYRPAKK